MFHNLNPVCLTIVKNENQPFYLSCPCPVQRIDYKTGAPKDGVCLKKMEPNNLTGSYNCNDGHSANPVGRFFQNHIDKNNPPKNYAR